MQQKADKVFITGLFPVFIIVVLFFCFLPFHNLVNSFNSDGAIPVMMAQDPYPSIFSFFYYGQSRFAAYPFLLAFFSGKIFNFTPDLFTIYFLSFFYFLTSLYFFSIILRVCKLTFFSLLGFCFLFYQELSRYFFSIDIVYIWQISSSLLYFYCLYRALSFDNVRKSFYIGSFLFSFLAISSNPVSLPFFLFLLVFFKVFFREFSFSKKNYIFYFVSFFVPFLFEELVKFFYSKSNSIHFGFSYVFPLERVEIKNFFYNVQTNLIKIYSPTLVFMVFFSLLISFLFFKLDKIKSKIIWLFIFLSAVNFFVCVLSRYAYKNGYDLRYFTPTLFFILLAFVYSLAQLFALYKKNMYFVSSLSFVLCIFSFLISRRVESNDVLQKQIFQSGLISFLYPKTILLGNYWDVYLYRGLQTNLRTASYPLPVEGDYNRTPWNLCRLKVGETVLVSGLEEQRDTITKKIDLKKSANFIHQFQSYGFLFVLQEDSLLKKFNLPFQRYKIVAGQANFFPGICQNQSDRIFRSR